MNVPNSNRLAFVSKFLLIVAAVVTLAFFLLNYPVIGHDAYFMLSNLDQYISSWSDGILIPRWTPNNFRGLGTATFYFYTPFISLCGALLHFALPGASLNLILNLFALLITFGAVFSFRWYLRILSIQNNNAWWGAIAYAIGPYPFFDVLVRSALPEYICFIWIPLLLIAIELSIAEQSLSKSRKLQITFLTGLTCILLVLSDIPITVLAMLAVGIYILVRVPRTMWRNLLPFGYGSLLAMLCLAFYIFPILQFRDSVHLSKVMDLGDYRPFHEFWVHHLLYGSHHHVPDFLECILFPLTIYLVILWYRKFRAKKVSHSIAFAMFLFSGVVILMHIPVITGPLSDIFPPFSLIQFPTRAYILFGVSSAVLVAFYLQSSRPFLVAFLLGALSLVTIGFAIFLYKTEYGMHDYVVEKQLNWNVYEYVPQHAPTDTSVIRIYSNAHMDDPEVMPVSLLDNGNTIYRIQRHVSSSEAIVSLSQPTPVRFHRFYWPQWRLTKSPDTVIPVSWDSNGALVATLPAGHYPIELKIVKSSSELLGEKLSLIGFLLLAIIAFFAFRPARQNGLNLQALQNKKAS